MTSPITTPYAVYCKGNSILDEEAGKYLSCGLVFLTYTEYVKQMNKPNALWRCPNCGSDAQWDDDNYEEWMEGDRNGKDL